MNLQDKANLLDALASPRRLHVLSLIAEKDRVTNMVVKEGLDTSQSNASFHHDKLTRAGILDRSKDAQYNVYEINRDKLEEKGIDLGKLINAPAG